MFREKMFLRDYFCGKFTLKFFTPQNFYLWGELFFRGPKFSLFYQGGSNKPLESAITILSNNFKKNFSMSVPVMSGNSTLRM